MHRRTRRGHLGKTKAGDAATYEKQNESACAAAPVLSEAPGAFLHFHPLFPLRPVLHLAPSSPSSPFGPSNRYCPSLRSLGYIPPHSPATLLLLTLVNPLPPSRPPSSARLRRFCRLQPLSLAIAMAVYFFLRFNTFLNERKNKYLHLDWIKVPPSIGFTDFTGDARRRRLNSAFFVPRLFSLYSSAANSTVGIEYR